MNDDDVDTIDFDNVLERRPELKRVPGTEGTRYAAAGPRDRAVYTDWLTPTEAHYILHRNEIPDLNAETWTVSITGAVEDKVALSMDEIREDYPTIVVPHTMECAGNGRGRFDPPIEPVAWDVNGVSTAFWAGTPLSSVLRDVGADIADDMWVTAIGGDRPVENNVFARSIPMSKIMDDCILAYEMNGDSLPPEHGNPIRLLVPGWYGVNSVKWLSKLHVMEKMVYGEEWVGDPTYHTWQQIAYRLFTDEKPDHLPYIDTFDTWDQIESDEVDEPYTYDQNVKSLIGYPDDNSTISPRDDGFIEVVGVAWAGDDDVETIEISTDGGETWGEGEFVGPTYPNSWRLFRYLWNTEPGSYTLVSRATDDRGRTQPATISTPEHTPNAVESNEVPWNKLGYCNNAYLPHSIKVEVTAP